MVVLQAWEPHRVASAEDCDVSCPQSQVPETMKTQRMPGLPTATSQRGCRWLSEVAASCQQMHGALEVFGQTVGEPTVASQRCRRRWRCPWKDRHWRPLP